VFQQSTFRQSKVLPPKREAGSPIAVRHGGRRTAGKLPAMVYLMKMNEHDNSLLADYRRLPVELKARGWDIDTGLTTVEEATAENIRAMY
jgi:hypothetical protein